MDTVEGDEILDRVKFSGHAGNMVDGEDQQFQKLPPTRRRRAVEYNKAVVTRARNDVRQLVELPGNSYERLLRKGQLSSTAKLPRSQSSSYSDSEGGGDLSSQ